MKTDIHEKQDKWATNLFIKDGCPPDEANDLTYKDAVKYLFDGDDEVAWNEFIFSELRE
jgi:hypothetical protein